MSIRKTAVTGALALASIMGITPVLAVEFNASIWFPESHPLTRYGYIDWANVVEATSKGTLKPRVFTGTVLLPPAGHLKGVRDGVAHLGYHAGTYTPADLPADNILAQLGFSYSDYFVGAFAITDMNMTDPVMKKQWDGHNLVYAGGYSTPPYRLMCKGKIENLADIKGKKLRMPGAAHSDWAKSVGAVPVNVPSSEMYNGLDKGQINCAANAANDLKSRSLWDVVDHVTLVELGVYWAGYEYGFNKDFWKSLSTEHRNILLDTIAEAIVKTGIGYNAVSNQALKDAASHNVNVIEPSADLKASIEDFSKKVRGNAIKHGIDKFSFEDPAGLITRFEQRIEKWRKLLDGVDRKDEVKLVQILKSNLYNRIDGAKYGID